MRIGHGYDVHRLVEGRKLILGGVEVPFEKGLLGHSDADVLAHAVMDAVLGAAALGVLGLPCALGYNVWSGIQPLGAGSTVLDFEDFLVSNLLLPIGAVVYLLFCVSRWGWGFENYLAEANTGKGPKLPRWLRPYFRYVLPLLIIVILVQGLL